MHGIARNSAMKAAWRHKAHAFVDKPDAPALQAADILAWQSNKYYRDRVTGSRARPMRKDFIALLNGQIDRYRFQSADGKGLENLIAGMALVE